VVHGVSVGVGFSTLDGTRLVTLDSDLGGDRRDLPSGARGVVRATLNRLDLQPGHYTLAVGARSGDNVALDYLPLCAHVEVFPGDRTPAMLIRDGGGVRLSAEWVWQEGGRAVDADGVERVRW
jgi:lipopolysaccharide transport system ATP-binding protein